jgi:hypothetical protein
MVAVPNSEEWQQEKLFSLLRDFRERLGKLERRPVTYAQRGTVAAFTGGSTTATVNFVGASNIVCRFDLAYTPVAGHKVWVIFTPEGQFIACRDSVP